MRMLNRVLPFVAAALLGIFAAGIGAAIVFGASEEVRIAEEARV